MTRNTERRVELACPVYDENIRERVHRIMEAVLSDTVKSRLLTSEGVYIEKNKSDAQLADSQRLLANNAEKESETALNTELKVFKVVKAWKKKILSFVKHEK